MKKSWNSEAMKQWNNEVINVLKYFLFFYYPPTSEEIHTFIKKKVSKQALDAILEKMEKKSLISIISNNQLSNSKYSKQFSNPKSQNLEEKSSSNILTSNYYLLTTHLDNVPRYTLGEYHKTVQSSKFKVQNYRSYDNYNFYNNYLKKREISSAKLQKILPYVRLLSIFPQIKLIGLSGSVAMLNADEGHDVDLFIITAKNRLFTGRFLALLLAQVLGIRRHRPDSHSGERRDVRRPRSDSRILNYKLVNNKVCLNLFFDESNIVILKHKRTEYVAHEVLQMKPLVVKDGVYSSFIQANKWVFEIFPNAKSEILTPKSVHGESVHGESEINSKLKIQNSKRLGFKNLNLFGTSNLGFRIFSRYIEKLFKSFQLFFIRRHQTTEIITDTQLWFHPDDFEKKLKK